MDKVNIQRVLVVLARKAAERRRIATDEAEIIGWATHEDGEHYPIHAAKGGKSGGGKINNKSSKKAGNSKASSKTTNKEKTKKAEQKQESQNTRPNPDSMTSQEGKTLVTRFNANQIEYNPIKKLSSPLSEDEIISRVGGGDKTEKGSCSSVAFAYIANKEGYEVYDFRGGMSRWAFSAANNINTIADLPGVVSWKDTNGNDFYSVRNLLANVEPGKEYYLSVGSHSAMVRKASNGYEYLELQSPDRNGWRHLDEITLKARFRCRKSHSLGGEKQTPTNAIIEAKSLGKSKEFRKLLGYLNTAGKKQVKGAEGYEK